MDLINSPCQCCFGRNISATLITYRGSTVYGKGPLLFNALKGGGDAPAFAA
jgi:hypothetical protein